MNNEDIEFINISDDEASDPNHLQIVARTLFVIGADADEPLAASESGRGHVT